MVTAATPTPPSSAAPLPGHSDFTGLAADYARYRPAYAPSVVAQIVARVAERSSRAAAQLAVADVGAGTGIFARMLLDAGVGRVTAIEPNADMLAQGRASMALHGDVRIDWRAGSGEHTGLADGQLDLLSMATAFHWVDFDAGTAEVARVLRPGGCFAAVWNPRVIDASPLMREIEAQLTSLRGHPTMRAGDAASEALARRLRDCGRFIEVDYLEGVHSARYSPADYLGLLRSVQHLRTDLGTDGRSRFLAWVARRVAGLDVIEAHYRTRAWLARTRLAP